MGFSFLDSSRRFERSILLVLGASAIAACSSSSSSGAGGKGSTGTSVATGTTSSTGSSTTTGTGSGSTSATSGSGSTGSGGPAPTTVSVANGDVCFTLATGKTDTANPCSGDMLLMTGANVDLGTPAISQNTYCPLMGTFTSLAAVPTDYTACAWTSYVEGAGGLANTGLLLVDAQGHHYRMHIDSNTLPNLVFEYAKID